MKKYIFLALIAILLGACNEDKFLKETPEDFMSGDNSYSTKADFDLAINELYYLTRLEFYANSDRSIDYIYGTDLVFEGSSEKSNLLSNYSASGSIAQAHWDKLYLLIAQSNIVLSRLLKSGLESDEQTIYVAKAKFFRGLAYRTLAYLYGGVPIELNEVTSPKTNYVRATYDQTISQAIEDVKFAAENLADVAAVKDGEVNAAAAYHLLSELYLASGQNQDAVDAATKVIDNPALALMQNRFGSRVSETPGNVYGDLFSVKNQNRSSGNKEGLWVIQFETNVSGGSATTSDAFWVAANYLLERHCAPQVGLFRIVLSDGKTQVAPFNWPIGDFTGGRGIGNAVLTVHSGREVWSSDYKNDLRNANCNIVRKFAFTNPDFKTKYGSIFGDSIDLDNLPSGVSFITGLSNQSTFPGRYLCPYQVKCTTPYHHPAALYSNTTTLALNSTAGGTYTDQYMFRLAETFLLRAEAYLKLGNTANAAIDINAVRGRSKASLVAAADVNMDYILDERLRELGIEEKRRLTLSRTGSFYDRVTRYNSYYTSTASSADGVGFITGTNTSKYILWPIPQSAIEANKDAKLEQNPGY
jgi:starch-binding outer membrane protein, SusD/RagB family